MPKTCELLCNFDHRGNSDPCCPQVPRNATAGYIRLVSGRRHPCPSRAVRSRGFANQSILARTKESIISALRGCSPSLIVRRYADSGHYQAPLRAGDSWFQTDNHSQARPVAINAAQRSSNQHPQSLTMFDDERANTFHQENQPVLIRSRPPVPHRMLLMRNG